MATYQQIQDYVQAKNGFVAKRCWIAHVLSDRGLTKGTSPNRKDPSRRVHPCPDKKRQAIEAALDHFGMR